MVNVRFAKGPYGFETMKLTGHAEFNPGNDIVCSAISALAQALVGTIRNVDGISIKKMHMADGDIDIEIEPMIDENARNVIDAIFITVLIGLKQIEMSYPDNLKVAC